MENIKGVEIKYQRICVHCERDIPGPYEKMMRIKGVSFDKIKKVYREFCVCPDCDQDGK